MKDNTDNHDVTDLSYLKQVSNGDNTFIAEMIDVYLRETPRTLQNLDNHLKNEDWENLRAVTHKMKPSLSFFGLKELLATANILEEYSENKKNLHEVPQLIEKVKLICTKAMIELQLIKEKGF